MSLGECWEPQPEDIKDRDKFQIPPFYPQFPDSPLPIPDPPVPVLTISRFPLFSTGMFQFPPLLSTPTGYNSQIPPFSLHPISRGAYILQIPLVKLVCSGHVQTGVVFRFSTGRLVPVGLYRYTPTGSVRTSTR